MFPDTDVNRGGSDPTMPRCRPSVLLSSCFDLQYLFEKLTMKAATSLLLVTAITSVAADQFVIPEKSWAIRGYEAFNGDRDAPKTATGAATVPKQKQPLVVKEAAKKVAPKGSTAPATSDGAGTKAMLGVGAAVAVAALGASSIGNAPKPQKALVEAMKKPVVAKPAVVKPAKQVQPEGASIPSEVFNLVKAIVGVGVLSLPAGVATFGSSPSAFVPAGILIAFIGILSGYGFSLIGKVCAYTGAKSYREAWSRTVGESTSWIPAWSTTCKTFLACLAFSMVLADTFSSLLETGRNGTLLSVTLLVLTPLCLMKDLKSLAPFSFLGVLGMAYTALAMTVRWLDGTYSIVGEEQGEFVSQLAKHLKPRFGKVGMGGVFSPNSLILVCMLSTAYMVSDSICH